MKELIIVVITLVGLFCGIKLEGRYCADSGKEKPAESVSENKQPQ